MENIDDTIKMLKHLSEEDKKKLNHILALRFGSSSLNYVDNIVDALSEFKKMKMDEKIEEWKIDDLKRLERKRKGRMLLTNADYIGWILDYLNTHEVVSNDVYFHYYKDKTPKEDQERIESLDTVFSAVSDYAHASHISYDYDMGASYDILYNGVYLRFGSYHNPESNREIYKISEDEVSEKSLMNFEDIMNYYIEYFKNENGKQKERK